MNEKDLALVVASCAEEVVCAAEVERRDFEEVLVRVPREEWDDLVITVKQLQENEDE